MTAPTYSPEMTATLEFLASAAASAAAPTTEVLSPAEQLAAGRARGEALASLYPAPADVVITKVDADGVAADLLTTPGVRDDCSILYLHGGGYVGFSAFTHRELASRIGRVAGVQVLVPEYRLAPENPYPAAVEDALAAYLWLAERGPVAVAGDSAGGGLSLALWLRLSSLGSATMPVAIGLISPWTNLTFSDPVDDSEPIDVELHRHKIMATSYAGDSPIDTPEISPLLADLTGLPPVHIEVSGGEYLEPDCVRLADKIRASNGTVTYESVYGLPHVYAFIANTPEAQAVTLRMGGFLAAALAGVTV